METKKDDDGHSSLLLHMNAAAGDTEAVRRILSERLEYLDAQTIHAAQILASEVGHKDTAQVLQDCLERIQATERKVKRTRAPMPRV